MSTKILASILNWRSPGDTISCVKAVQGLPGYQPDVVVIDNASGDGSVELIKETLPDIVVIETEKNLGYAGGHQLAVDYAMQKQFDAIWILNPDLKLHHNSLIGLLEAWKDNGPGIYGSISLQAPGDCTIQFAGAHELNGTEEVSDYNPWKGRAFTDTPQAQLVRKVSAIEGFSLFAPLEIIRQYGFMDHRYFMYGEETIWCYDLRKKGVPIFIVPVSIVYHKGFGSLGENGASSPVVTYYRMRNAIYWKRKHYGLKWLDVLKRKGGPLAQMKFFIKYLLGGKSWRLSQTRNFVENIAILHALVNYKGKWHWLH